METFVSVCLVHSGRIHRGELVHTRDTLVLCHFRPNPASPCPLHPSFGSLPFCKSSISLIPIICLLF